MELWQAIILGIVEGVTEFLPVSSTGHLTIVEKLLGFSINDKGVTAFTAIIQVGAILATLVYFRSDIVRIVRGFVLGILKKSERGNADYRFGWAIILGSVPIAIVGLLFKNQIESTLRSLWVVAGALILWSFVMFAADRPRLQTRGENSVTWKDTLIMGLVQCIALVPGVSRSGATISAGLLKGLDRVAATRLSFFLAIPALLAAGALEAVKEAGNVSATVGWTPTIVATATSFVVAYASIAWLLKFIARNTFTAFITYRIMLGGVLLILLGIGTISAT